MERTNLGTEQFRWDLSFLYKGADDPQIDKDLQALIEMEKNFKLNYKSHLATKLGSALADYEEIEMLSSKINDYLFLKQSLNTSDPVVKAKTASVNQITSKSNADHLTFFMLELVALDESVIQDLYKNDSKVKSLRAWLEYVRVFKPHYLSEPVESALTIRTPFGPHSWSELFVEIESDQRYDFRGQQKNYSEITHILNESKDKDERADALRAINEGSKGFFAKYSAQNLYMVTGSNAVEVEERRFANPMSRRNKLNRVTDNVVDALHNATTKFAAPIAKKYYLLKSRHLNLKTLAWSDRNAPLPFNDNELVSFPDALDMVIEAYQTFSPTMSDIIKEMRDKKSIDAPVGPTKKLGAYNASLVLPGKNVVSMVLMNYLGSKKDITTLAHELGHAVHGILGGRAQSPLSFHAPIAFAETASVFGEMITFDALREKYKKSGNDKELLGLLMKKIEDTINTMVRQISFSNFERRIHGIDENYKVWSKPKKMSVEELSNIWLKTTKELYGEEGEVFTYKNLDLYWSLIPHFHTPFYVYGYAFGQLLTQSLYVKRNSRNDFVENYLDLLSSGATRDVVELLKPFDLDPTNESFWADGINNGIGKLVDEAIQLSAKMGITLE